MVSALTSIKVIDVSQAVAVPIAARYLGDFGEEGRFESTAEATEEGKTVADGEVRGGVSEGI